MKQVHLLRLITGDNIVAQVDNSSEYLEHVIVDNPISVITSMNMDGSLGTAFVPWATIGKADQVQIARGHIVAMMPPAPTVLRSYERYLKRQESEKDFQKLSDREKHIALLVQSLEFENGHTYLN